MGGFFDLFSPSPQPMMMQPLPPPPRRMDPAAEERERLRRLALKRRKGFGGTILTSGLGDIGAPLTDQKKLLGG